MNENLVFCRGCQFLRFQTQCVNPSYLTKKHNAVGTWTTIAYCNIVNKNNDCKFYQEASFGRKIINFLHMLTED